MFFRAGTLLHMTSSGKNGQTDLPGPDVLTLKDYKTSKHLIEGSSCEVKLAKHVSTNRQVCLKVMSKRGNSRKNVDNEVSIMRQLQRESQYILKLHGMCETDDDYILVCDYMNGGDLFDCIVDRNVGKKGLDIFYQVAQGVKACHDADIAHGDIKPENILLDKHGNVKLADFGLSRRVACGEKVKHACGSFNYIAPEVESRAPYDPKRADMWSLGIVLYSLLTGYLPSGYDGDTNDPLSPANVGVGAVKDPQVRDLLDRMLVPDPAARIVIDDLIAHSCLRRERIKRCTVVISS